MIRREIRLLCNIWLFNGIPHPPHRLDIFGPSGRFLQLLPDPGDMGHDGIVVIQIFFAPHRLKQFLGGNYASLMLAEIPENIELDGGQDNFLAVYAAVVGILVYM